MLKSLNFALRKMGNHWQVLHLVQNHHLMVLKDRVASGDPLTSKRFSIYHLFPGSIPISISLSFHTIQGMSCCKDSHNYDVQRNHFCCKHPWCTSYSILISDRSNLPPLLFLSGFPATSGLLLYSELVLSHPIFVIYFILKCHPFSSLPVQIIPILHGAALVSPSLEAFPDHSCLVDPFIPQFPKAFWFSLLSPIKKII